MDEHQYNGNAEYTRELLIRIAKLFGIIGLGTYAVGALQFTLSHFRDLIDFERQGLADIGTFITQPRAEPITASTIILVVLFIVLCILALVYLEVVVEKWVKRIGREWVKVVNCNWLKSVKDFFLCLGGALFELVETVTFALVTFVAFIIGAINIAVTIWFIGPYIF
jgi:hypothetical protein